MDDVKIKFSSAIIPGIVISLVMIVLLLILQFTVDNMELRQKIGYITWLIVLGIILYYGIQFRNAQEFKGLSYKKSFTYLFYVMLVVSVIIIIFNYINFTIIDPGLVDVIRENAEDALYNNPDIPENQIDKIIENQAIFMTAGWLTFFSAFGSILFSLIVALVGAIFVKKEPTIEISE